MIFARIDQRITQYDGMIEMKVNFLKLILRKICTMIDLSVFSTINVNFVIATSVLYQMHQMLL